MSQCQIEVLFFISLCSCLIFSWMKSHSSKKCTISREEFLFLLKLFLFLLMLTFFLSAPFLFHLMLFVFLLTLFLFLNMLFSFLHMIFLFCLPSFCCCIISSLRLASSNFMQLLPISHIVSTISLRMIAFGSWSGSRGGTTSMLSMKTSSSRSANTVETKVWVEFQMLL